MLTVVTIGLDDRAGLERTRRSVAEQIAPGLTIEHVVVDGGSTDGSREFLETLDGVDWTSEPDRGRYDAMNKGLARAHGDFVWLLHSGDTFGSPRAAAVAVDHLVRTDAAWGYGVARKVTATGECVGMFGAIPFGLRRFSLGGRPVPHQAALFSRELVERIGPYDLEHGNGADQLYLLKCAIAAPPAVVPEFLCDFDVHGVGSQESVRKHFRDMSEARRRVGYSPFGHRLVDWAASLAPRIQMALGRSVGRRIR